MSSEQNRTTPLGLRISAIAGLLFLHLPLALIFLYAFTTEEKSFQFPPPGYTTKWFWVAWSQRPDIWPPLYLSLEVAAIATFLALIFGTLAAAALSRAKFFGRETISLLVRSADRASRHHHRHLAALGLRHHGHRFLDLDHRSRPRHLLHRGGLQQRRRPVPARSPAISSRRPWISAPTASRPSATSSCRKSAPRFSPAACSPSRCRSTRSSSPPSPPASSRPCRSGCCPS